jgi:hypothetical protein
MLLALTNLFGTGCVDSEEGLGMRPVTVTRAMSESLS